MLYEPEGLDPARWPDSYWRASHSGVTCPPLAGRAKADVAIIGAGYAGLNAALELVEQHGARVIVVDAAQPGWGASGRNGGFCCKGGARIEGPAIGRRLGAGVAEEWAAFQRAAIERVRDNLDRYAIDAQATEPGELRLASTPREWRAMQREGGAVMDPRALREAGFDTAVYHGGILGGPEEGFGLHPYAYVTGLAGAALDAGVTIHGDSPVTRLDPAPGGWVLRTAGGELHAPRVLIATNGYSDERLPRWLSRRILPAISNIMVTRPLTGDEIQAQGWTRQVMAYDERLMLHYFRLLPDNRFLFGARGGLSFRPASVAAFARRSRAEFDMIFPAFRNAETEYEWNGLVCLTASLAPYIGPVPGAAGLWLALGWHGNGVAAASEGGRVAARAVMGAPDAPPALTRRPPPRFALPRKPALAAGMALAGLVDGRLRPRP